MAKTNDSEKKVTDHRCVSRLYIKRVVLSELYFSPLLQIFVIHNFFLCLVVFNKSPGDNFRFGLIFQRTIGWQVSQLLLCGYHFKIHNYTFKLENKNLYRMRRNVKMWQTKLHTESKSMRKAYFYFLFLCRNNEVKNYLKYSFDLCNSS